MSNYEDKFTPTAKTTYPGTDDDKDPWLHRLGDVRTTIVKYKDGKTFTIDDNWLHVDANQPLPEQWTGETIFEYLPEKKGDQTGYRDYNADHR